MKHYKLERPTTESEVIAEDRPNWLTILLVVSVALLVSGMLRYRLEIGQALAAETAWHTLAKETPTPGRLVWIETDDNCARLVRYDERLGFYTSHELVTGERWLSAIGDPPPLDYCQRGG